MVVFVTKMIKKIDLGGKIISYSIKTSRRTRKLKMAIYADNQIVITAPKAIAETIIERFVLLNKQWLIKKLLVINQREKIAYGDYDLHKIQALNFIKKRLEVYLPQYGYKYKNLSVRNQKTRWGSCSVNKTLSFNYKLLFIPIDLADYVIVHELCHLQEMNHSNSFWKLVAKTVPDYMTKRKKLKNLAL